jgi:hypothetical protein
MPQGERRDESLAFSFPFYFLLEWREADPTRTDKTIAPRRPSSVHDRPEFVRHTTPELHSFG